MNKYLNGVDLPPKTMLIKIANYFFLDKKFLLNDSIELPENTKLQCDENLVKIQRDDFENQLSKNKNKHYISRSYAVLGHNKRISLFISVLFITVPLLSYASYCTFVTVKDRLETIEEYKSSNYMSKEEEKIKSELMTYENNKDELLTYTV